MKHLVASVLMCLLGNPLIAGSEGAAARMPSTQAVLSDDAGACRAQLNDAARALLGRGVILAADAFAQNDSVVLSTLGQSASGRMLPPAEILRLQLTSQGCQLQHAGRDQVVALPYCSCRAIAGK